MGIAEVVFDGGGGGGGERVTRRRRKFPPSPCKPISVSPLPPQFPCFPRHHFRSSTLCNMFTTATASAAAVVIRP